MALAMVTGGNRGLGFESARQLIEAGFHVIVCARREEDAVGAAHRLGSNAHPHQLDLEERACVAKTLEFLNGRPPLDVLINNAGISLAGLDGEVAARTLNVNTWGAARLTDGLRAQLAPGARVVMVSSGMGSVEGFSSSLQERLLTPDLNRDELHRLGQEFVLAAREGTLAACGFPTNAYAVSKALLNGATRVLAREWGADGPRVNAVCPGWVRTDMGGPHATRSVQAGARGILWAARLAPSGPTGGFYRDGAEIPW